EAAAAGLEGPSGLRGVVALPGGELKSPARRKGALQNDADLLARARHVGSDLDPNFGRIGWRRRLQAVATARAARRLAEAPCVCDGESVLRSGQWDRRKQQRERGSHSHVCPLLHTERARPFFVTTTGRKRESLLDTAS